MSTFLEIVFPAGGIASRDEVEEVVEEAIADLGEVTGGGSGSGAVNVDVELFDDIDVETAVAAIAQALVDLNLPVDATTMRVEGQEPRSLETLATRSGAGATVEDEEAGEAGAAGDGQP